MVGGPTTPSRLRPADFCRARTACWVNVPNLPSGVPSQWPSSLSRSCSSRTFSPRSPRTRLVRGFGVGFGLGAGCFVSAGVDVALGAGAFVTLGEGAGVVDEYSLTDSSHGFRYEAAEFARALEAGRLETWSMPWEATRRVMAVMDEVRRQVGVVYPGEQRRPTGCSPREGGEEHRLQVLRPFRRVGRPPRHRGQGSQGLGIGLLAQGDSDDSHGARGVRVVDEPSRGGRQVRASGVLVLAVADEDDGVGAGLPRSLTAATAASVVS